MQVLYTQQNQGKYFCLHSVLTIFLLTVLVVEYNVKLLQEGFYIEQVQAWNKSIIESINVAVRSTKNQELEQDSSKSSFTKESTSKIEKVENQELESLSSNSSFANESAKLWSEAESMKTLKQNVTPVFNATTTKFEKVESLMDKINKDQKSLQGHIKEVCLRDGIGNGLNINTMESRRMIIDQKRHFAYCGIGKVLFCVYRFKLYSVCEIIDFFYFKHCILGRNNDMDGTLQAPDSKRCSYNLLARRHSKIL